MKRALDTMGLVFWMLRQDQVPRKALQVFLGREVHTLQFRRPLFGVFDYLWKAVADGGPMVELNLKETEELFLASFSQPMRYTDLKAGLHEVVTASDASESGGGLVYGTKLTSQGVREAYALEEGLEEMPTQAIKANAQEEVVLVFDMFAGIGGLSQALKLAGLEVSRLVVVEKDPGCRRVNKVRFPGCDVITDINTVTKDQVEKIMRSVPGLTGVVAGGGSPCQGLSKLSVNRRHLEDPRSKLFFKLADILMWVAEVAEEMQVWHLELVENVVGDEADVQQMTKQLGWKPIRSCASGLSRVRRPRLFWCSESLEDHPCFTRVVGPAYDEHQSKEMGVANSAELPMARTIRYQETKEMRRRERQQIGRLQDQQVSQTTVQRYSNSMQDFVTFGGFSQAQLLHHPDVEALLSAYIERLEALLSAYIERLWEDGDTKTMASYTVAAVQYFQPRLKGQLKQPWKLLSLWSKLEQPRRATPLSPDLLLAVAGQFTAWRWQDLGHLCVVGFCGFLRTGEMFQLKRSHVVLPRSSSQDAVLFIQDSKTAKRNFLQWEKVIISEQVGVRSLRALCAHRRPDDLLVDVTPQKFRDLWKHLATARLYLDQGLQEYASLTVPPAAHPFIRAAQQRFRSAG
eukprot:Skav221026  [mRNA]  locus=scaffold576:100629:103533:- [translate_table: standard]